MSISQRPTSVGRLFDGASQVSHSDLFQKAHSGGESGGVIRLVCRRSCIYQLKGLILAQNERWRRGLGMQVERVPRKGESGERDSNT